MSSIKRFLSAAGRSTLFYSRLGTWCLTFPIAAVLWVLNGFTSLIACGFELGNLLVGGSATLLVNKRFRPLVEWQLSNYIWNTWYFKSPDDDGFSPGDQIDDDGNPTFVAYSRFENSNEIQPLDKRAGRHAIAVVAKDMGQQLYYVSEARRANRDQELPPFAAFMVALIGSSLGFALTAVNLAVRVVAIPVSLLNICVTGLRSGFGHLCYHISPSDAVQSKENFVTWDFFWDAVYYVPRKADDIF
jgi:hypothetical protein